MASPAAFFHSTPIILISGRGGSGKSTVAHRIKREILQQSGKHAVIEPTDRIAFPKGDPKKRLVPVEERKRRYEILRKRIVRHINEKPGVPIIVEGMFNTEELRQTVLEALESRHFDVHTVNVTAPFESRVARLQRAERNPLIAWRTRHGSKLTSANLIKYREQIDHFEEYAPELTIDNEQSPNESKIQKDVHEFVGRMMEQHATTHESAQSIRKLFERIDASGEPPREKMRQLLLHLRQKFRYDLHGDVSLTALGPRTEPDVPFDNRYLKFWHAIGRDEPLGLGEYALDHLENHITARSKTGVAWLSGENKFQRAFYKGLKYDTRIDKITGEMNDNAIYLPIPPLDAAGTRNLHPLGQLPNRPLGVVAFYSKKHKTEQTYRELEKIVNVGKSYLQRWIVDEYAQDDPSQNDLNEKIIQIDQSEHADKNRVNHSLRVAKLARNAAEASRAFGPHELEQLETAAHLHDIEHVLPPMQLETGTSTHFPFHQPDHDIVKAVSDMNHVRGTPLAFLEDEEGQLTRIANLGAIGQLSPEQQAAITHGRLSHLEAWTRRVRDIIGKPENVERLRSGKLDIGTFSPAHLMAIAGGLLRLKTFKLKPPRIQVRGRTQEGHASPSLQSDAIDRIHPYTAFIQAAKAFDQMVTGVNGPKMTAPDAKNQLQRMARQGTLEKTAVNAFNQAATPDALRDLYAKYYAPAHGLPGSGIALKRAGEKTT